MLAGAAVLPLLPVFVTADGTGTGKAHPALGDHAAGGRVVHPDQSEEQVLDVDRRRHQPARFLGGALEHALRLLAEGDVDAPRSLRRRALPALELRAEQVDRDVASVEELPDEWIVFAQEPEEQVLGSDDRCSTLGRLVASQEEHALRLFRELFDHAVTTCCPGPACQPSGGLAGRGCCRARAVGLQSSVHDFQNTMTSPSQPLRVARDHEGELRLLL